MTIAQMRIAARRLRLRGSYWWRWPGRSGRRGVRPDDLPSSTVMRCAFVRPPSCPLDCARATCGALRSRALRTTRDQLSHRAGARVARGRATDDRPGRHSHASAVGWAGSGRRDHGWIKCCPH